MRALKNANYEYIFYDITFTFLLIKPNGNEQENNEAPVEDICSQLISHQLKDFSLLVQVSPPASQIGRQEATAWQVGWLWQHSYQSMAFQETQA